MNKSFGGLGVRQRTVVFGRRGWQRWKERQDKLTEQNQDKIQKGQIRNDS